MGRSRTLAAIAVAVLRAQWHREHRATSPTFHAIALTWPATVLRTMASVALILLVAFQALRLLASRCLGSSCEIYIPLSALIPLLALLAVAATGFSATRSARRTGSRAWAVALSAVTLLGVMGPIAALVVLRDHPDAVVIVATALEALVPLSALLYSSQPTLFRDRREPPSHLSRS